MQIRDLIPWGRERHAVARKDENGDNPLIHLQKDINRVFDDFWRRFDQPLAGVDGFWAGSGSRTDVSESDREVEVTVELPGMDEKDVDVSVTDDLLTIRGEKKEEKKEERKGYHLAERSYGSFYRTIPLPAGVDTGKAKAAFRKGVLTVTLPKSPEAQTRVKRIEVKSD